MPTDQWIDKIETTYTTHKYSCYLSAYIITLTRPKTFLDSLQFPHLKNKTKTLQNATNLSENTDLVPHLQN